MVNDEHLLDDAPLVLLHHHHVHVGFVLPVELGDVEEAPVFAEERTVVDVGYRLPDLNLPGGHPSDKAFPGQNKIAGNEVYTLGGRLGPLWSIHVGEEIG